MELRAETASAAVAAQAQAAVQARYVMALRNPRDWDVVRQRLMKECDRPGFAEVARYSKPIGGENTIDGLSIRFAEAALRCMTNCLPETMIIYEDDEKRIVRVSLTDLEANLTYSKDILVKKTVERNYVRDGQVVLSERANSRGKKTYLIQAGDDEVLNKQSALESKALRGHVLRVLPGDIADEAEERVLETLKKRAQQDPAAERKRIIDAFGQVGVPVDELKLYVGKPFEQLTPSELVSLRSVHNSVKNGEARWPELLEARTGKTKATAPTAPNSTGDGPSAPSPASAQPSDPVEASTEVAPVSAVDPLDVLADSIPLADARELDAYQKQVAAIAKDHPRRNELGNAINLRRRQLKEQG
ncbi:hypothetical protein [Myxococcus sp. CA040A]|uniref:hypothetical protein n=1 Tax=Myxococcus sp. CA040A TaxID=2741738 RepID=UPI00157ADD7F|nr:hypothetical protein [Myxococcus sp. CA040A]NTX08959.1 hypothetical protein [Myxococcus sp. CA040A]